MGILEDADSAWLLFASRSWLKESFCDISPDSEESKISSIVMIR